MQVRTARETEILDAAARLGAEYRRWLNETADDLPPDEAFEQAVEEFLAVCDGDIPASCRELIAHTALFGSAWRSYTQGEEGFRQPDWRPTHRVLSPLEAVLRDAKGVETYQPKRPEPIQALLAQGVSKAQICREIYGRGGVGPFCGPNGNPIEELLEHENLAQQELKKVRSQLAFASDEERKSLEEREQRILASMKCGDDWVHPTEQEARDRASKEHRRQIAAATASRSTPAPAEDPLALLREGAYAEQVARVCGLPIERVHQLAAENGITIQSMPNLASTLSPYEPQPSPERLSGANQPSFSQPDEPEEESAVPAVDLSETIATYHEENPELGPGELAAMIRENEDVEVSGQKVAAVLRAKKKETAATA